MNLKSSKIFPFETEDTQVRNTEFILQQSEEICDIINPQPNNPLIAQQQIYAQVTKRETNKVRKDAFGTLIVKQDQQVKAAHKVSFKTPLDSCIIVENWKYYNYHFDEDEECCPCSIF